LIKSSESDVFPLVFLPSRALLTRQAIKKTTPFATYFLEKAVCGGRRAYQ
jgi:hypothetical protein